MAFDGIKSLFNAAADGLQRLKFNAWTLGGRGAEIFEKSAEALQLERINPLRGVDEWRLGQIFDDARDGIFADLAWLYNEIEGVEPALSACCEMRESAASECGWLVKTADADRTRGFDKNLAEEQRVALLAEFGAVEDDLADLASHLVSAFFRGAAHAAPLWNADGSLAGFRKLDLWNMAFDRKTGIWYWNADASRDEGTFQPIPPGELVTLAVSSSRHVDHAALPIFIRAALGTKRYGVWLDRFGIPPVAVIMPPNAEKGEQADYMDLARKFARGGNGILPNGSAVSYGTEARAVCPFPDFIRFQEEQIYTIGIGRIQSGANDAANLGGNAAGVVEAGFTRIVRRDARHIARAINDTVTAKVLKRLYPGKPVLAQFAWDTEKKRTSREVLEDAGYAKTAGLAIDINQVSELTGYKLTKAEEPAAPGGPGGAGALPSVPRFGLNAQTPLQTLANGLQNAPRVSDGQGDPSGREALVEALQGWYEKILAEAAAEAVEGEEDADAPSRPSHPSQTSQEELANSTDAQGNEHAEAGSNNGGQFVAKGKGGEAHTPEQKKRIEKYQAAVDDKALFWRERVLALDEESQKKEFFQFGTSDKRMAADLKEKTGIDTDGWPVKMQGNHAVHIEQRHGARGAADQSMADPKDFARIGYVLKNYDSVELLPDNQSYRNKDNGPAKQVEFRTCIDGTMAVQTVVPDTKRKTLFITSTRIEKRKDGHL